MKLFCGDTNSKQWLLIPENEEDAKMINVLGVCGIESWWVCTLADVVKDDLPVALKPDWMRRATVLQFATQKSCEEILNELKEKVEQ